MVINFYMYRYGKKKFEGKVKYKIFSDSSEGVFN